LPKDVLKVCMPPVSPPMHPAQTARTAAVIRTGTKVDFMLKIITGDSITVGLYKPKD